MSEFRNVEEIGLDEITEDFLRDECIDMGMDLGVDTRQGSIYRDAAEGHIIRTTKFFDDLRMVNEIISLATCTGDVLDDKLKERGLQRNPPEATPARYYCNFEGEQPEVGDMLTCEGHVFYVESVEDRVVIVSEETGTDMNSLPQGVPVVPEVDVDELISCTLEEIAVAAQDEEDDDTARQRLINKISGPDESANISQVKSWCEAQEGVGRARVIPLWNGPLTTKAVIITPDGTVPSEYVVDAVQEFLDPGCTGLGEGMCPIGLFATVAPAEALPINIEVTIQRDTTYTLAEIQELIEASVTAYLKGLALAEYSENTNTVRYTRISSIISNTEGVIDYSRLYVNETIVNIVFTQLQIPTLGTVTVHEYE